VLSYVADGTPTNHFIRVDPLLGIFGVLAICIMSSRHCQRRPKAICIMSSRHARVVQISRNYSTHMQLGSDATATEMGRESNLVRCSKRMSIQ
jgi:hypothetical protein